MVKQSSLFDYHPRPTIISPHLIHYGDLAWRVKSPEVPLVIINFLKLVLFSSWHYRSELKAEHENLSIYDNPPKSNNNQCPEKISKEKKKKNYTAND
jgi:hypothetical protein